MKEAIGSSVIFLVIIFLANYYVVNKGEILVSIITAVLAAVFYFFFQILRDKWKERKE